MTRIESGTFQGYAITFGTHGDFTVRRGAFTKTLQENLYRKRIKLAFRDKIVGIVVEAVEKEHGLWFKAQFNTTALAQDVRTKVSEGILNSVSIRYSVIRERKLDAQRELLEVRLFGIVFEDP